MSRPRPLGPLKFKYRRQEIVFRRDSVHDVAVLQAPGTTSDKWQVKVNGYTVFEGSEPACRKQYERALKYI